MKIKGYSILEHNDSELRLFICRVDKCPHCGGSEGIEEAVFLCAKDYLSGKRDCNVDAAHMFLVDKKDIDFKDVKVKEIKVLKTYGYGSTNWIKPKEKKQN